MASPSGPVPLNGPPIPSLGQLDQEKKRSVPKKGVKHEPPGLTHGISLLPYEVSGQLKCAAWGENGYGSQLQGCVVLKFGGSSLGQKLGQVVELITRHAQDGPIAVAVSAMGKSTDLLIDAADKACLTHLDAAHEKVDAIEQIALSNIQKLCPDKEAQGPVRRQVTALLDDLKQLLLGISLVRELSPPSLDRLLSYGERLSATVVAHLLSTTGTPAHFVDGKSIVVTDDEFGMARVEWEETQRAIQEAQRHWPADSVPIVTGFLGATEDGRRTTLGRNGSDYTAALLGAAFNASKVIINTDVPGVFTADPGIVREAYPVPVLSYVEAMELSIYGSRMFHPRTILPLVDKRIPMIIRNTDDPDGLATTIMDPNSPSARLGATAAADAATCVTHLEHMALLSLRSRLGQSVGTQQASQHIGLRCASTLDTAGVKIHHASFAANGQAVHVVVDKHMVEEARAALLTEFERELRRREIDEMTVWKPVTLLSLVRAPQTALPKFFAGVTAARVKIRTLGQGSDSSSVSCVIDSHDTPVAVRCAHTAINLGHQIVSLLVLGNNSSSRGLLRRLLEKRQQFLEQYKVELRVVGVSHTCCASRESRQIELVEDGVDLEAKLQYLEDSVCTDEMEPAGKRMSGVIPVRVLQRLRQMSCPIVVDCNRLNIEVADFYKTCCQHGIHVVVSSAASVVRLGEGVSSGECYDTNLLTYDTSIGASVPIGDMVRRLNQMGDRVGRVEGVLSGTCNYICTLFNDGLTMSAAAEKAVENGYSEPRVVTDMEGLDTARKLVALARLMGRRLELKDIVVEPLIDPAVIEELREAKPSEQIAILKKDDARYEALREKMRAGEGRRLVYVADLDLNSADSTPIKATVKPQWVADDHHSVQVKGIDIYVHIHRQGYSSGHPLVLQGPGCGSSSALGIVGDILKVAFKLQGAGL